MTRPGRYISPALKHEVFATLPSECAECGWKPGDQTRAPRGRPARKGTPVWMLEIDHITPLSRGGKTELANLQLLCSGCNASKGTRDRANPDRNR